MESRLNFEKTNRLLADLEKWGIFSVQILNYVYILRAVFSSPRPRCLRISAPFPPSVFFLNLLSIHSPFSSSTFTLAFPLMFFSSLDGGRDGQQGFQENKNEGASHRRFPGLCQRKQGCTGEGVTACQHAHTHTHTATSCFSWLN